MGNTDRKSARKKSCGTKALAYTYDAAGQIAPIADPNGQVSTYTYTDTGRLDTITAPGSKVWNGDYNSLQKRGQTRLSNYRKPNQSPFFAGSVPVLARAFFD